MTTQISPFPARRVLQVTAFALVLLLTLGCSNTKTTFLPRTYHTFVSLFNGYYHANLKYKEAVGKVTRNFEMKPDELMSVVDFVDSDQASSSFAQLNQVIEKCDLILYKHKNGRYVDDCHFLKGKAWFWKGNQIMAQQLFNYVLTAFPKTNLKPEILLWLSMSYTLSGNKFAAQRTMEELKGQKVNEKRLKADVAAFQATYAIQQQDYNGAIRILEDNLRYMKPKLRKARTYYLLAQLYDLGGSFEKARDNYRRAIALNTHNQINFNAELAIAQLYIKHKPPGSSDAEVTKSLNKLLKDTKYREFHDQIYYQFALLAERDGKLDQMAQNLRKAIDISQGNERQKALCYAKLGELHFYILQELPPAQIYYDSAAFFIPESHPRAAEIKTIATTLGKYAAARREIHLQDSLQKLSSLDSTALDKYVDQLIDREEREAELEKQRQLQQQQMQNQGMFMQDPFAMQNSGQVQSNFLFDNPSQIATAKLEFQRMWGDRKLEDHWRRRNKMQTLRDEAEAGVDSLGNDLSTREGRKAAYIAQVPKSPEATAASHEKIIKALLDLGQLFSQKLNLPDSAIAAHEDLLRRYPNESRVPRALYALHFDCKKAEQHPKAKLYRDRLINEFPNSPYTQKLLNTNSLDELDELRADFNSAHTTLLMLFNNGDYKTAINFTDFMIMKFANHPERCKILYIRGASYGYLGQMDSLDHYYNLLVKDFPDCQVTAIARKTLDMIGKQALATAQQASEATGETPAHLKPKPDVANTPDLAKASQGFLLERIADEPVIGVFLIEKSKIAKADLQTIVANFHAQYFKSDDLRVTVLLYQNNRHLVYITQFGNYQTADAYLKVAQKDPELLKLTDDAKRDFLFASSTNFRTAFTGKRFDDYITYFKANRAELIKADQKK